MNRVAVLLLPLLSLALPVICATAHAEDISPPASEWRGYCKVYLAAVDGSGEASDLEVTYCIGVTKGLLAGLTVGSQIGALSFGSRLAVVHDLDPDEVFKEFQRQEPARLLGICSGADATTPDFVRAVLSYLDKNPAALRRPIGEVFFEGLEAAYPCR